MQQLEHNWYIFTKSMKKKKNQSLNFSNWVRSKHDKDVKLTLNILQSEANLQKVKIYEKESNDLLVIEQILDSNH